MGIYERIPINFWILILGLHHDSWKHLHNSINFKFYLMKGETFTCIFMELHPPRRPRMCHDRIVCIRATPSDQSFYSWRYDYHVLESNLHRKLRRHLSPVEHCRIQTICMNWRNQIWQWQPKEPINNTLQTKDNHFYAARLSIILGI